MDGLTGLDEDARKSLPALYLPMRDDAIRSYNLSNAVSKQASPMLLVFLSMLVCLCLSPFFCVAYNYTFGVEQLAGNGDVLPLTCLGRRPWPSAERELEGYSYQRSHARLCFFGMETGISSARFCVLESEGHLEFVIREHDGYVPASLHGCPSPSPTQTHRAQTPYCHLDLLVETSMGS